MKGPSVLTLVAFLGVVAPAQAETKRLRIPVSSIPRQDNALTIDPKHAVLPDGVREGSPVPKRWKIAQSNAFEDEFSHCTDGRRASVASSSNTETGTEKIWEANGKVFFDRARVKVEDGKIHVLSAERVPVVYVDENIWAYRTASTVRVVFARDSGVNDRAVFWGCFVEETWIASPTGAATMESSPERVNEVIRQLSHEVPTRAPSWKGVTLNVLASVSKASADTEPMLNLVIRRP
jgi:hypothetical protein